MAIFKVGGQRWHYLCGDEHWQIASQNRKTSKMCWNLHRQTWWTEHSKNDRKTTQTIVEPRFFQHGTHFLVFATTLTVPILLAFRTGVRFHKKESAFQLLYGSQLLQHYPSTRAERSGGVVLTCQHMFWPKARESPGFIHVHTTAVSLTFIHFTKFFPRFYTGCYIGCYKYW